MQKKILGIAVAAALAAPLAASAQSGVQIYGVIDLQAMHQKFDDTSAAGLDVSKAAVHSSASRLGFRGRESLGGGLNAWFQAEMGISADGRPDVDAVPNGVNDLGGRDTGVGLDGNWGTVMIGGWGTPYKVANLAGWNLGTYGIVSHYGVIMNEDTTGTEASPNCAAGGGAACDRVLVEGSATGFGRRAANSVQYWSPNWGGFQARLGTTFNSMKSPDGSATPSDPELWSGSIMWRGGAFTVAAAYERHNGFRPSATNTDPTDDAWMVGGKWTAGAFAVGAGYEVREYENTGAAGAENGFERKSWVVNATFNLGSGQLFAGYSTMEDENCGAAITALACGSAGEADMLTLGYAHNLSKRTKAYINFGNIDNGSAQARYYIAGPAGNAGGGASGGITAGTDVRTIGVGVQHSF